MFVPLKLQQFKQREMFPWGGEITQCCGVLSYYTTRGVAPNVGAWGWTAHKTTPHQIATGLFSLLFLGSIYILIFKLTWVNIMLFWYNGFKRFTPGNQFESLESCANNSMTCNFMFVKILRFIIICICFSTFSSRIFARLFFSFKSPEIWKTWRDKLAGKQLR